MDKEQIKEMIKKIEAENKKRDVIDFFLTEVEVPEDIKKVNIHYERMFENEQWLREHIDHMGRIYINVAEREVSSCTNRWKRTKVFVKKCIRKMLRWYINPVCEQQSEFNATCFYAIREVRGILDGLLNHYCDGNNINGESSEQLQKCAAEIKILEENMKNVVM